VALFVPQTPRSLALPTTSTAATNSSWIQPCRRYTHRHTRRWLARFERANDRSRLERVRSSIASTVPGCPSTKRAQAGVPKHLHRRHLVAHVYIFAPPPPPDVVVFMATLRLQTSDNYAAVDSGQAKYVTGERCIGGWNASARDERHSMRRAPSHSRLTQLLQQPRISPPRPPP